MPSCFPLRALRLRVPASTHFDPTREAPISKHPWPSVQSVVLFLQKTGGAPSETRSALEFFWGGSDATESFKISVILCTIGLLAADQVW